VKSKLNWAVIVMAGVFAGSVVAASEKPPESYVAAMKAVNASNGALRGHVTAKDYAGIEADAKALKAAFETTLKFWEEKKVENPIGWAKAAVKAAENLEEAAKAKNDEGIGMAQKAIGGSCMQCHNAHRDRQPDGTSLIK
jgi:cytochrome c556